MQSWLKAALTGLLASLAWFAVKKLRVAFDIDLHKIPGPFLSRFTNLPLKGSVLSGTRTKYIHALHQSYGPIVRISPDEVSFADISAHHEIHRVGSPFIKGTWYQSQSPLQTSDETCGVFGLRDRKIATARRKLFQQAGTRAAVHEWEPLITNIVDQAVAKIKRDAAAGTADLVKWWSMMTADVLGTLAFGEPFRVIEKEEKPQMLVDIEQAMIFVGFRTELRLLFELVAYLPLPVIGRPINLFYRFTEYGQLAVKNTKAAVQGSSHTLFSKMYPEDGSQPIPDSIIAQEAANIIIAGSDTTAMTLTYLVWAVLRHPEIKKKLLGDIATCSAHPGWEELEGKRYLNNVIQETLRLYPVVPGTLPRVVPEGGHMLAGYKIPGGTTVGCLAYTFQRDPRIFSEPERFNPDRWNSPSSEMKEYMMPFGGSARFCLGQNIAQLELLHAVVAFFRACPEAKIAAGTTEKSMDIVEFFVIKPAAGKFEVTTR